MFAQRYAALVDRAPMDRARAGDSLPRLGRDLYDWLDGADGQMHALLQHAVRPLRFAIAVPHRLPSVAEWALLRAPWELLADANGFLAGDVQLGFSPVRRIGPETAPPKLDSYRLGLVFMAAAPEGVRDLEYEGEDRHHAGGRGHPARSPGGRERQSGRTR